MHKRIHLTILLSASCHLGVLAANTNLHTIKPDASPQPDSEPVATTYVVTLVAPKPSALPAAVPEQVPANTPAVDQASRQPPPQAREVKPVAPSAPPPRPARERAPAPPPPPVEKQESPPEPSPAPERPALPAPSAPEHEPPAPIPRTEPAELTGAVPAQADGQPSNADELERYLAEIKARIEAHKFYPAAARRRGIEGGVQISFVLDESGAVRDIRLSNAHRMLTNAVRRALEKAAPFTPPPLAGKASISLSYTISFTLNQKDDKR